MGAVGCVRRAHNNFVLRIRQGKLFNAVRVPRRRDFAHLQRQGQPRRSGAHDRFQRALRHNILRLRLLRRNDNLPWHDGAHGGRRARRVAQNPYGGRRSQVAVGSVRGREWAVMLAVAAAVTVAFTLF